MSNEIIFEFITTKLSEFLGRTVAIEDLDIDIEGLGADSMNLVVLAFELENYLDKKIRPEIFFQHKTIRSALEEIISSKSGQDS
jgi:acyl carrier protein